MNKFNSLILMSLVLMSLVFFGGTLRAEIKTVESTMAGVIFGAMQEAVGVDPSPKNVLTIEMEHLKCNAKQFHNTEHHKFHCVFIYRDQKFLIDALLAKHLIASLVDADIFQIKNDGSLKSRINSLTCTAAGLRESTTYTCFSQ